MISLYHASQGTRSGLAMQPLKGGRVHPDPTRGPDPCVTS